MCQSAVRQVAFYQRTEEGAQLPASYWKRMIKLCLQEPHVLDTVDRMQTRADTIRACIHIHNHTYLCARQSLWQHWRGAPESYIVYEVRRVWFTEADVEVKYYHIRLHTCKTNQLVQGVTMRNHVTNSSLHAESTPWNLQFGVYTSRAPRVSACVCVA